MIPKNYELIYSSSDIAKRIAALAPSMNAWILEAEQRTEQQVLVLGVLQGAIFMMSDLLRQLSVSVEPAFCRVSSYSKEDNTQGELQVFLDGIEVRGRAVLLVDDICDTGATMEELNALLESHGATEVRSVVLIRRMLPSAVWNPDWSAIEHSGAEWFVGYGMDDCGKYRNLPDIYYTLPEA